MKVFFASNFFFLEKTYDPALWTAKFIWLKLVLLRTEVHCPQNFSLINFTTLLGGQPNLFGCSLFYCELRFAIHRTFP